MQQRNTMSMKKKLQCNYNYTVIFISYFGNTDQIN